MNTVVTGATPEDRREYVAALRRSGMTLQEIGEGLGVSRERARQLCIGRTPKMHVSLSGVDPVKLMRAARIAVSMTAAARLANCDRTQGEKTLRALGVLPALRRLWRWRRSSARRRDVIARLQHGAALIGRTPTAAEMLEHLHGLPDPTTVISAFGNVANGMRAAGLTPRPTLGNGGKHVRPKVGGGGRRRMARCNRGHEFTSENTRVYVYHGTEHRRCRACACIRSRADYERRKQRIATQQTA